MQFSEGQTVIHPHHGPATITQMVDRTINGTSRRYVHLQVHQTSLEVAVPLDTAEEVGLRPVYAESQAHELIAVLRAPSGEQEENWSRRFKANQEKLRVGELNMTAEVVRDLTRRQEERGLSTGEKEMLQSARQPVLAELALSLSLDETEVDRLVDTAVRGEEPDPVGAAQA
ncbi:CarD family transcriptional regulator [Cellulomonas timonensis]|uniref:CarD family transcriptional regulator n=1 Tax=Cellulomonas timonensis TaxID=1689271 RepID=UPI00082DEDBA|nr:CarD family transcriptional regulator [Cellulomonas timonensis]